MSDRIQFQSAGAVRTNKPARPTRPMGFVIPRLLSASDEAAMIEYLKLACRPPPERRARIATQRHPLDDTQFDADFARDEREWTEDLR